MNLLIDEPPAATKPQACFLFAHGAGAPMDSDFMAFFAQQLALQGIRVVRFEFPYMQQRRETGTKRPPNPQAVLLDYWRDVISEVERRFAGAGVESSETPLFIGGKSMGGRMASLLADELFLTQRINGLVCLGYPFHPPGKPDKLRVEHLAGMQTPTLILQGQRDTMGNENEVADYLLSEQIVCSYLPDGDHSFKPRKRSGYTEEQNWLTAINSMVSFLTGSD